jgi:hypothetical protein
MTCALARIGAIVAMWVRGLNPQTPPHQVRGLIAPDFRPSGDSRREAELLY